MNNQVNNYFNLLGLTPSFSIDKKKLSEAYRKLQQTSHPDRFVNQPTEMQRQAVQQTANNTEAYHCLKSSVKRACHLLAILGNEFNLNSYTVTDINLLMQQMQYREQLADIKEQGKYEQLSDFAAQLDELTVDTEQQIQSLFDQDLNKVLGEIKNHICELQFLNKLAIDLDEVEEHLLTE